MTTRILRFGMLSLASSLLADCGGSSGADTAQVACQETGTYACLTGETEPLYTFGGLDLNVEPVHRQGLKGQEVNVLVLDSGTDLHNEDLAPNADLSTTLTRLASRSHVTPTSVRQSKV